MDITRGRELQERIGLDALTQWTLFGTATDTGMQERCIRIVGKTWDIPEEETQAWLDAIARERSYAESGSSEHVRPDDELPVNLSGLETLNMTWDLFETAAQMDDPSCRRKIVLCRKCAHPTRNCGNLTANAATEGISASNFQRKHSALKKAE